MFTAFAFCLSSVIATAPSDAAEQRGHHELKYPYKGGTRSSEGGGVQGEAYMALIDAAYKDDFSQILILKKYLSA